MNRDANHMQRMTVFHCINSVFDEGDISGGGEEHGVEIKAVQLPCSGMVKDVFLLRAFEAGSDAVIVITCPEGQCRHLEGNIRARKRVEWVKKRLDAINFDGRRLSVFDLAPGDVQSAERLIRDSLYELAGLGPSPIKIQTKRMNRPPNTG